MGVREQFLKIAMGSQPAILCIAGDMTMGADMPVIHHIGLRLPQSTEFSMVFFGYVGHRHWC